MKGTHILYVSRAQPPAWVRRTLGFRMARSIRWRARRREGPARSPDPHASIWSEAPRGQAEAFASAFRTAISASFPNATSAVSPVFALVSIPLAEPFAEREQVVLRDPHGLREVPFVRKQDRGTRTDMFRSNPVPKNPDQGAIARTGYARSRAIRRSKRARSARTSFRTWYSTT